MWYYWVAVLVLLSISVWAVSSPQTLAIAAPPEDAFDPTRLLYGFDLFIDNNVLNLTRLSPGGKTDYAKIVFQRANKSMGFSVDNLLLLQHIIARISLGVYTLIPSNDPGLRVIKIQDASLDGQGNVDFVRQERLLYSSDKGTESWKDTLRGSQVEFLLQQDPYNLNEDEIRGLVEPCLGLDRNPVTMEDLLVEFEGALDNLISPNRLGERLNIAYLAFGAPPGGLLSLRDAFASNRYKNLSEVKF